MRRAGDVIPEITGAKLDERPADAQPFAPPQVCPRCGGEIDRTPEALALRQRPGLRRRESLAYFTARDAMDIEGLGDKILDALVAAGLVTDPADLYDLDVATLAALDRLGTRVRRQTRRQHRRAPRLSRCRGCSPASAYG